MYVHIRTCIHVQYSICHYIIACNTVFPHLSTLTSCTAATHSTTATTSSNTVAVVAMIVVAIIIGPLLLKVLSGAADVQWWRDNVS
jgi:hypothetical protein